MRVDYAVPVEHAHSPWCRACHAFDTDAHPTWEALPDVDPPRPGASDADKAHSLGVPYWEQITVREPCRECGYDVRLCTSDPVRCCTRCTHVDR